MRMRVVSPTAWQAPHCAVYVLCPGVYPSNLWPALQTPSLCHPSQRSTCRARGGERARQAQCPRHHTITHKAAHSRYHIIMHKAARSLISRASSPVKSPEWVRFAPPPPPPPPLPMVPLQPTAPATSLASTVCLMQLCTCKCAPCHCGPSGGSRRAPLLPCWFAALRRADADVGALQAVVDDPGVAHQHAQHPS